MPKGERPHDPIFDPDAESDDHALLKERIVQMRVAGWNVYKIAEQLTAEGKQISWNHVQHLIREAAQESSARLAELVDTRRMEQDQRVEYLISLCMEQVRKRHAAGEPIEGLLKTAVTLFDRHARLLGLDINRNTGVHARKEWIEEAPFETVLQEAKKLGLVKPDEFRTATF